MQILYLPVTRKRLLDLPYEIQDRIVNKIEFYASQPDPLLFAKSVGKRAYRFRVGDYRIIFFIENETINVIDIDRRDKVYK